MGSHNIVFYQLLTVFVWIMAADGRIFESNMLLMYGEQIDASLSVILNTGFGFGKGGTFELSLLCPPTTHDVAIPVVWLLACTTMETRDVLDPSNLRSELNSQACQKFEKQSEGPSSLCTAFPVNLRWATPNGSFWHATHLFTGEEDKFFKFLMLQCPGRSHNSSYSYVERVQCTRNFTLLNDFGTNHLSKDEGPLLYIYKVLTGVWSILLLLWFINWIQFRQDACHNAVRVLVLCCPDYANVLLLGAREADLKCLQRLQNKAARLVFNCGRDQSSAALLGALHLLPYSNKLHKLLCVAPVVKFVQLILALVVWERIKQSGRQDSHLQMGCYVVQSTEDAMLFMTMMMASEGWCVLRPHIKNIRCALIPVLFLVFLGSVICVVWVHHYFMAFAVCCIVFVIYRALKWCSYNLDILHRQLLMTTQFIMQKEVKFKQVSIITQLMAKRLVYLRLRLICAVFTMVFAVVATMSTFLTEFSWIKVLAFEMPELVVYFCLGMIFRLKDFGPYEDIEVITPKEKSVIFLLPHPDVRWPMRQKLVLGSPMETPVDELTEEDELLKEM